LLNIAKSLYGKGFQDITIMGQTFFIKC